MNAKTLKALKGSITKWERIAERRGVDLGPDNCPLCKLFYKKECVGCPVMEKTGRAQCYSTPYITWANLPEKSVGNSLKLYKLAKREQAFLAGLLP